MLELKYTPISQLRFLEGNSKLHDIGELCQLFERHGFKEPLIWDKTADAIVSGNGRLEALLQLQESGNKPPDNIKIVEGEWAVPVIYGGDAKTLEAAIAYSIDANLSILGGGSFPVNERMKLFDTDALMAQLEALTEADMPPITFDEEDMEELTRILDGGGEWNDEYENADDTDEGDLVEKKTLNEKFIVPPFSVLDARQGYWQARKQMWLGLGIQSELGRGDQPIPNGGG